jgi:hypothetical protein
MSTRMSTLFGVASPAFWDLAFFDSISLVMKTVARSGSGGNSLALRTTAKLPARAIPAVIDFSAMPNGQRY